MKRSVRADIGSKNPRVVEERLLEILILGMLISEKDSSVHLHLCVRRVVLRVSSACMYVVCFLKLISVNICALRVRESHTRSKRKIL